MQIIRKLHPETANNAYILLQAHLYYSFLLKKTQSIVLF